MLIGELLIKSGLINETQLNEALEIQKRSKKRLGEILIELGYLKSHDLIWLLSEQASIPFIDLKPEVLNSKLILSFPEKLLYQYCIIPLYEIDNKLYLATGNPADKEGIEKIKEIVKKEVVVSAAEPEKIIKLLDSFFLAEQTQVSLGAEDFLDSIEIEIDQDRATIKLVDTKGNIKKFELKGKVIIRYTNKQYKEPV
ncbi:MAG: hypothetical protein N3A65_00405 [candidate division WOR-3 bacterium]|nr:hypothetical protein [candidate division WOR-3 bacterium]